MVRILKLGIFLSIGRNYPIWAKLMSAGQIYPGLCISYRALQSTQMETFQQIINSPVFSICLCIFFAAVAVSGKFSHIAANLLLFTLWIVGSLQLMRSLDDWRLNGRCNPNARWILLRCESLGSPAKETTGRKGATGPTEVERHTAKRFQLSSC